MKTANFLPFLLSFTVSFTLFSQSNIQQSLSVNADGSAPNVSAQLDVSATDKGMLVPRMTTAQRVAIASPATGLLVFDTTTGSFFFFNGSIWVNLSSPKVLADADGDTKIQVEESPNEDIIRFDLGGTENMVLQKNTSGVPSLAFVNALNNTCVGLSAGISITTAQGNTAVGFQTLQFNTTGNVNAAFGGDALRLNASGSGNTAVGNSAMSSNTSGSSNTAIGGSALSSNLTGNFNMANGQLALLSNTSGTYNTASGGYALNSNTTGDNNTAAGLAALYGNTTGFSNVGIGMEALRLNTTRSNLVAVGDSALYNNGTGASISYEGTDNTALGSKALFSNNIGFGNTATGRKALYSNTSGFRNTATGTEALYSNLGGLDNTANGYAALYSVTGSDNTANGSSALYSNNTGSGNTANGAYVLYSNTTGSNNTANGKQALSSNFTGSNNTALGANADVGSSALQNATAIGYRAEVAASNSMLLGSINGVNSATASVKVGIGDAAPSHFLTVKSAADNETMRLIGNLGTFGHGARLNFGDGDHVYIDEPTDDEMRIQASAVGIKRTPLTNDLEVEGTASKSSAGDWLANSDARLKKNIQPLNSQLMLQNLLALQGITYEWNDDQTGSKRPEGIQYGFTAQNIQVVFPTLVEEDKLGYLQTAYGTYDAMTVEAIRALNEEIGNLKLENAVQAEEIERLKNVESLSRELATQLEKITAALQGAGIAVEK